MSSKKQKEPAEILADHEILTLFFSGFSIDRLTRKVAQSEQLKLREAREKVERTIFEAHKGGADLAVSA